MYGPLKFGCNNFVVGLHVMRLHNKEIIGLSIHSGHKTKRSQEHNNSKLMYLYSTVILYNHVIT